jgi:hypothetical protein
MRGDLLSLDVSARLDSQKRSLLTSSNCDVYQHESKHICKEITHGVGFVDLATLVTFSIGEETNITSEVILTHNSQRR